MISPWSVLAGAAAAGGIALLIAELRPAPPDLGQALDRLHRTPADRTPDPEERPRWFDRIGERSISLRGVRIPERDLALIGRTPARFMAHKLMFALIGLVLPPYLVVAAMLLDMSLPFVLPLLVGPLLAGLFWFLPDAIVRGEAKEARVEYLHGVAAYLELVAMERAADLGPAEALRRAAAVGRGAVFRRIRDALDRAATDRLPPWAGLDALAVELGLTPLQDVADIMRISGTDGAAVYDTLRARAKGLRGELLAEDLARANSDSERMVAPGAALTLLMTVLIIYPALHKMLN
ncbi:MULTISPECIES: type II secretion system F family protein [unclassified Streptomyces]|uniref:type II secretion system F family protein n=1 Tax=Streptomycetaceae TaxID=2062 RepID=UPI002E7829A3|nr:MULTISPECIES: type II secretion system F family protein [unclassified Streptomyces]MED7949508.1 type II secretion system F family protein [Streptomyces sp. BE303]MEE1824484.1 type II secretion system F family protein [Streptomyces sp. BE20]